MDMESIEGRSGVGSIKKIFGRQREPYGFVTILQPPEFSGMEAVFYLKDVLQKDDERRLLQGGLMVRFVFTHKPVDRMRAPCPFKAIQVRIQDPMEYTGTVARSATGGLVVFLDILYRQVRVPQLNQSACAGDRCTIVIPWRLMAKALKKNRDPVGELVAVQRPGGTTTVFPAANGLRSYSGSNNNSTHMYNSTHSATATGGGAAATNNHNTGSHFAFASATDHFNGFNGGSAVGGANSSFPKLEQHSRDSYSSGSSATEESSLEDEEVFMAHNKTKLINSGLGVFGQAGAATSNIVDFHESNSNSSQSWSVASSSKNALANKQVGPSAESLLGLPDIFEGPASLQQHHQKSQHHPYHKHQRERRPFSSVAGSSSFFGSNFGSFSGAARGIGGGKLPFASSPFGAGPSPKQPRQGGHHSHGGATIQPLNFSAAPFDVSRRGKAANAIFDSENVSALANRALGIGGGSDAGALGGGGDLSNQSTLSSSSTFDQAATSGYDSFLASSIWNGDISSLTPAADFRAEAGGRAPSRTSDLDMSTASATNGAGSQRESRKRPEPLWNDYDWYKQTIRVVESTLNGK